MDLPNPGIEPGSPALQADSFQLRYETVSLLSRCSSNGLVPQKMPDGYQLNSFIGQRFTKGQGQETEKDEKENLKSK